MYRQLHIKLDRSGAFFSSLPLLAAQQYFADAIKQNPQRVGEYKAVQMRLQQLQQRQIEDVIFQASDADRVESLHLKQLTAQLLSKGQGEIPCTSCGSSIDGGQIIHEMYQRAKTSGQRFYCHRNHLIFELIDFKGIPQSLAG